MTIKYQLKFAQLTLYWIQRNWKKNVFYIKRFRGTNGATLYSYLFLSSNKFLWQDNILSRLMWTFQRCVIPNIITTMLIMFYYFFLTKLIWWKWKFIVYIRGYLMTLVMTTLILIAKMSLKNQILVFSKILQKGKQMWKFILLNNWSGTSVLIWPNQNLSVCRPTSQLHLMHCPTIFKFGGFVYYLYLRVPIYF